MGCDKLEFFPLCFFCSLCFRFEFVSRRGRQLDVNVIFVTTEIF